MCCARPRAATSTSGRSGPATRRSRTSSLRRPAPGNGQYSHERYHNQYALLMALDHRRAARGPDRRTFVLSRAGFAAIQRYAAPRNRTAAASWVGPSRLPCLRSRLAGPVHRELNRPAMTRFSSTVASRTPTTRPHTRHRLAPFHHDAIVRVQRGGQHRAGTRRLGLGHRAYEDHGRRLRPWNASTASPHLTWGDRIGARHTKGPVVSLQLPLRTRTGSPWVVSSRDCSANCARASPGGNGWVT